MRLPSLLAALLLCAARLDAQCADGSPPPCQVRRPAAAPAVVPAMDANRVAILPFRVAASDTLLGEGFAELLASEFTGQGMPRAVDMGTALQAWRRAGGGLRSALSREQTFALARSLGAGVVSEGSIVGLGRQLTITATLIDVATGRPRGNAARVTVSADSIDYALRRVGVILTAPANAPAQQLVSDDARFTASPEALRDYLEGMAAWRNGRFNAAAAAFDRAIARDSLFARAMFRRLIAQTWGISGSVQPRRVLELRDRLSDAERTVLLARWGSNVDVPRTVDQSFADAETALRLLPDNADVLYTAGDLWHHVGAAVDPENHLRRAVTLFSRAAAIDSQATVIQHLLEAAYRLRDTTMMRQAAAALERTGSRSRWQLAWLTAAHLGDERWLNRLRTGRPEATFTPAALLLGAAVSAPVALYDEMFDRWLAIAEPGSAARIRQFASYVLVGRGRPEAARAMWKLSDRAESGRLEWAIVASMLADVHRGDSTQAERWLQSDAPASDSAEVANRRCLRAALAIKRGATVSLPLGGFGRDAASCELTIRILRAPLDAGDATVRALSELDSIVRQRVMDGPIDTYEAVVLARAWERAGHPRRALNAIRYRQIGNGLGEVPWNYVHEGRLAAAAGDTAGAIRAYTLWLEIMEGAEPPYDAWRAEVRAALAKLRGATP